MEVDCLQESQDTTVIDDFDGDVDHSSSASPCVKLRINPWTDEQSALTCTSKICQIKLLFVLTDYHH